MAPVDLFSFYIYMRDQQKSVDYLDFWSVQGDQEVTFSNHQLITYQARCLTASISLPALRPATSSISH